MEHTRVKNSIAKMKLTITFPFIFSLLSDSLESYLTIEDR